MRVDKERNERGLERRIELMKEALRRDKWWAELFSMIQGRSQASSMLLSRRNIRQRYV